MTTPGGAYVALITDHMGFVMTPGEAIDHVESHRAFDPEEECGECPARLSIRTGSALPSPPDQHGLNSRVPSSWQSSHLLVEYDALEYDEPEDMLDRLRGWVVVVDALAAAKPDPAVSS